MKYLKAFEQYSGTPIDCVLNMLQAMAKLGSGIQQKLAKAKLAALKPVKCVNIIDAVGEKGLERIKKYVRPKQKECYANALHTAEYLRDLNIEYCEGYMIFFGIPIDHAFNKIGDVYFDVTQELALGKTPDENDYCVLGEWDPDTALRIMASGPYKCYGDVFNKEFFETHQEKIK